LVVTFSRFDLAGKDSRVRIWEVQDHLYLLNHVLAEHFCVISGASETVGLVETPRPRVASLHP
jgi:hypothetical protein